MKAVYSSKISGSVNAPASKSVMIRAVAASILSTETSRILNPTFCDDSMAAIGIARTLGAKVVASKEEVQITGIGNPALKAFKDLTIQCRESGLCMRMFTPILSLADATFIIEGAGSLKSRLMRVLESLSLIGVECETDRGYPPVAVKGPMHGGSIEIDGSHTSQFLTGLLMSAPLCDEQTEIRVKGLKSKPYIEMTLDLLKQFRILIEADEQLSVFRIRGKQEYAAQTFTVEGDWSGAAFLLVAGATAGAIEVRGLKMDSYQADGVIIDVLKRTGVSVDTREDTVTVKKNCLNAFEFDATDCPALVPPLIALAAHCQGVSRIYGTERLRHKESDRVEALVAEFAKLSIRIEVRDSQMEIYGGKPVGNLIDPHNDHRIAMACVVAALNGKGPVVIENHDCVAKSYPDFFRDIHSVQVML